MIVIFIFFIVTIILMVFIKPPMLDFGTYTNLDELKTQKIPKNIRSYIAVIRHGERYPTKKVYKKIGGAIDIPTTDDLTGKGYNNMIKYGENLRTQMPYIFNEPNNYIVLSTTVKRAEQSAQAALEGLHSSNKIKNGPMIDDFLKIDNFFIKSNTPGDIYSCQFSKILDIDYNGCDPAKVAQYEAEHDRLNYLSIVQNHKKGEKFYNILSRLIKTCRKDAKNRGYLFFCHDSTIAPLFYYFGLLPEERSKFKNNIMLPFGARLEFFIINNGNVEVFLNGKYFKTI